MNNNVRKLTDGAMMCAIVGVMLLINRQMAGMLEELLLFIFPLPMVFYSAKYGMRNSWIVLAAMVLLTVIVATPQTLFYVASESMIGLIYGAGIHDRRDTRSLVWLTIVIAIAVNIISTLIYASFFGYDLVAEMTETKEIVTQTMDAAGVSVPATINMDEFIKTSLVVATITTGVMQGYITHMLSRLMLKRMRFDVPKPTPVAYYYPPVWSGYAGFACMAAYYYTSTKPLASQMWQNVCTGAGMCGMFYLLAYGAVAVIVFSVVRNPRRRKMPVILAILMVFAMPMILSLLGFLYITTDLHRRALGGTGNA